MIFIFITLSIYNKVIINQQITIITMVMVQNFLSLVLRWWLLYNSLNYIIFFLTDYLLNYILFNPTFSNIDFNEVDLIDTHDDTHVIKELIIPSTNNVVLRAIHKSNISDQHIKIRKCILYSHGNTGHIYGENKKANVLLQIVPNVDMVTYDYRGYGKSTGVPTEKGIYDDIQSVWLYMTNVLGYHPNNIIIHGYSLGTVPTLWLANNINKCHHVVVQAGFPSIKSIVNVYIKNSYLCTITEFIIQYLTYDKFNNVYNIRKLNNKFPITVFHSVHDKLIPFENILLFKVTNMNVEIFKTHGSHNEPIYENNNILRLKYILE
jgi:hypothetical protein